MSLRINLAGDLNIIIEKSPALVWAENDN